MNVESIVKSGQGAVKAGVETLRSANAIVADSVQTLVKTQRTARREVVEAAQISFGKAKSDAAEVVSKASEELAQTFRRGYETLSARLHGELSHKDQAEAKKAAVKAKKAAKAAGSEDDSSGNEEAVH
jgi:hypothetical protein